MRRIEHTNIVALKYFFYSGGERKVRDNLLYMLMIFLSGRSIFKFGSRVGTREYVQNR